MAGGDSDNRIASEFDVNNTAVAVHRLKHLNLSPARMGPQQRLAYEAALSNFAIASKSNRLAKLQAAADRLERIIEDRAREYAHLVGGSSGLLVPRKRGIGTGETAEVIEDEVFDVFVLREYRSTLEQAAKECGEWDITGAGRREDTATAGANVTIQQVIHGHAHTAIAADPRPGSRSLHHTREPLTLPEPVTPLHSTQSVAGRIHSDDDADGLVVEVDGGPVEGEDRDD